MALVGLCEQLSHEKLFEQTKGGEKNLLKFMGFRYINVVFASIQ